MKFSFLGVGLMGSVLAKNILNLGHTVTIYSRSQERRDAMALAGTLIAQTQDDLAQCDVLCTCLPLPEHVSAAVLGENGLYAKMPKGSIHVEFSTIDPGTAKTMSDDAEKRGIAYIQCTVGKPPHIAARGEAPLNIGGNRSAIDKLMPIFKAIGKPLDVDSIEASCGLKLLGNLMCMGNLAVLAEGLRIGSLLGIDGQLLLDFLRTSCADSFQLSLRGDAIVTGDFTPAFGVDLALKDLKLGNEMAHQCGYKPELIGKTKELFQKTSDAGFGNEDAAAVYKVCR